MEIFVELGRDHAEQIIDTMTLTIPKILLKLMKIPNMQTRRQVTFWKTLLKCLEKIENQEVKRLKLQALEPVLTKLMDEIIV